jgi:hypothetical protein
VAEPGSILLPEGSKIIGTLPPGEWQVAEFDGVIVLACAEHAPMAIINGELFELLPHGR